MDVDEYVVRKRVRDLVDSQFHLSVEIAGGGHLCKKRK